MTIDDSYLYYALLTCCLLLLDLKLTIEID